MPMQSSVLLGICLLIGTLSAQNPGREKRGFSLPARRVRALSKRDGASSAATEHVVVDFTFGGQQLPVALDSGSSFTWVASTLLDSRSSSSNILPTLYNPNVSSTYHDENDLEDAYDCSGNSAKCFLGLDDVSTAGITAEQMTFGVATHINSGVFESGQAATMGFGRQSGDPADWKPRDQTFWYRAGGGLPMPYLFTVDIYGDRNGTFDFGYIDQNKYQGDIIYADMDTSRDQWNFNVTGFAIGNSSIQDADEFTGLLDTGGPNIGLPAQVVNAWFSSFGGTPSSGNSHNYPCSAYPPPDLTLRLASGGTLVLNSTFLVQPPDGSGSETCAGRLDDSEQTMYNFGQSVFDQKFIVFDSAGKRVGFADKASFARSGSSPGPENTASTSSTASSTSSRRPTKTGQSATSTSGAVSTSTTTTATTSPTSRPNVGTSHDRGQVGLLASCLALIAAFSF